MGRAKGEPVNVSGDVLEERGPYRLKKILALGPLAVTVAVFFAVIVSA
jgi:hypothetical protein